jgi:hypothetical protein
MGLCGDFGYAHCILGYCDKFSDALWATVFGDALWATASNFSYALWATAADLIMRYGPLCGMKPYSKNL